MDPQCSKCGGTEFAPMSNGRRNGKVRPPRLRCVTCKRQGDNVYGKALWVTGKGMGFYRWLQKNEYPAGFRVLCHNCNHVRGHVRGRVATCPHERLRMVG